MTGKNALLKRNFNSGFLAAAGVASAFAFNPAAAQSAGGDTNNSVTLPPVVVTAQKISQDANVVPVSVTAVTRDTVQGADLQSPKDAVMFAPNTFMSEFTARAQSTPFFRGIGGGLGYNPGVTTYIDGVPQLNFYSANLELIDVGQVEILRGPQSGLWGRNTAGGLINISSTRPSDTWTGQAVGSYGNFNYGDFRASISGPIVPNQLDLSLAGGYSSRDGYVTDQNGRSIDGRQAEFGKGQLLFIPTDRLELQMIVWGETDRDGDYALGELDEVRANPRVAQRVAGPDVGFNNRDIAAGVLQANYRGEAVDLFSTTGVSWWHNNAKTDWDYGGAFAPTLGLFGVVPFYESNIEKQDQFTQEFRAASSKDKPIQLGDALDLSWQSGVFLFDQSYRQTDVKNPPPQLASAALDDLGVGVFGQAKLTAWDKLDFTAAVRYDYEDKKARLGTAFGNVNPPVADFGQVTPEFGLAWRFSPEQMVYARVAEGYKAGGFNPLGVPNNIEYGPERTWNYELGHKATWLDGKLETTAALFYIDWQGIQLGQLGPPPFFNYFIVNSGAADSKGAEFELKYRPLPGWDLFGSVGYTDAKFQNSAVYLDGPVSGNRLPSTPDYTVSAGTQVSWAPCEAVTLYARAQVNVTGEFVYDPSNVAGQGTYSIANFRAGVKGKNWFVEGWVNNAFDTHYVPIAFNLYDGYPGISGSTGYVGESGAPVTYGIRGGFNF